MFLCNGPNHPAERYLPNAAQEFTESLVQENPQLRTLWIPLSLRV
jgi:hypothetical protein